ncbi:uncharacterized protein [Watersipora subatra]|uniref:uncharacterized protein n=1 Tax=Watersipora subatra TaxID=2589382 RepID=UPI00355B407D
MHSGMLIFLMALLTVSASARSLDVQESLPPSMSNEKDEHDVPLECVLCQTEMHAAQKYLFPQFKSKTQIALYITTFCDLLNLTTGDKCISMGEKIGDELWNLKDATPKKICQELGACPASQGFIYRMDLLTAIGLGKNSSIECTLCRDLVDGIKDLALSEEPWIAKEIDSLFCDGLPKETADTCKKAIDQDLPAILEKYIVPLQICGYAKMC